MQETPVQDTKFSTFYVFYAVERAQVHRSPSPNPLSRSDIRDFTRGGHDWTDKYSRVIDACHKLKCQSALIDGEVIVQDKNGLSDFAALRAAIEGAPHPLVMFAFDILFLAGEDLRRLPLIERRERLSGLLPEDQRCPTCDWAT